MIERTIVDFKDFNWDTVAEDDRLELEDNRLHIYKDDTGLHIEVKVPEKLVRSIEHAAIHRYQRVFG